MPSMNIFAIGASKNTGYYASQRLLAAGAQITFLLRSPSGFDADETMQKYIKNGKVHIVKGDALVEDDVKKGWEEAQKYGPIDICLFTVGGKPTFHPLKGFIITPENLVSNCLMNVLCTMPSPYPKLVTISSTGLTKTSHDGLPCMLKPVYGYLLALPHKDKVGAERLIAHCAGWEWNIENDGEPGEEILPQGWTERKDLPTPGTLKEVLVVRPAWLTDGECRGDGENKEKHYRTGDTEIGGWTISRKDVAHFIADAVLNKWNEYNGKCIRIAY